MIIFTALLMTGALGCTKQETAKNDDGQDLSIVIRNLASHHESVCAPLYQRFCVEHRAYADGGHMPPEGCKKLLIITGVENGEVHASRPAAQQEAHDWCITQINM